MSNDERINDFFYVFKNAKFKNPEVIFTDNTVYHALTRFGVSNDPKGILIQDPSFNEIIKKEGLFSRWVTRFLKNKNTHAIVTDNYFCYFEHGDINNNSEFIKIYVPLKKSHIEKGVNKIFDFIDNEGITHTSKVASDIRIDDVVVRVQNKIDADKIINFIKNDNYIQEGLLPPNPFAFNKEELALACDRKLSYNTILAALLKEFINNSNPNNLTSNIFYNYLQNLQNNIKNNNINLDFFISKIFNDKKPSNKDFERVLSLIINSHSSNFTYNDYLNHFYSGLNNRIEYNINQSLSITENLYNIICIMNQKYDLDRCIALLYNYILTGDIKYIPQIENLRNDITNINFRNKVHKLLKTSNLNFNDICLNIITRYQKKDNNKTHFHK